MAVIEAAGGVVTNWHGGPCDQGGQAVAVDARRHKHALELLAPFAD
jgi:myo-inositol-1(or 4)-monophosphatase